MDFVPDRPNETWKTWSELFPYKNGRQLGVKVAYKRINYFDAATQESEFAPVVSIDISIVPGKNEDLDKFKEQILQIKHNPYVYGRVGELGDQEIREHGMIIADRFYGNLPEINKHTGEFMKEIRDALKAAGFGDIGMEKAGGQLSTFLRERLSYGAFEEARDAFYKQSGEAFYSKEKGIDPLNTVDFVKTKKEGRDR